MKIIFAIIGAYFLVWEGCIEPFLPGHHFGEWDLVEFLSGLIFFVGVLFLSKKDLANNQSKLNRFNFWLLSILALIFSYTAVFFGANNLDSFIQSWFGPFFKLTKGTSFDESDSVVGVGFFWLYALIPYFWVTAMIIFFAVIFSALVNKYLEPSVSFLGHAKRLLLADSLIFLTPIFVFFLVILRFFIGVFN